MTIDRRSRIVAAVAIAVVNRSGERGAGTASVGSPDEDSAPWRCDAAEILRRVRDGPAPPAGEEPADGGEELAGEGEPGGSTTSLGWLELFFDLVVVVVAAVAVIVESFGERPSAVGIGVTFVLCTAVWQVWVSYVLCANVAKERARIRLMLLGMFLVAAMAAANPVVNAGHANAAGLSGALWWWRWWN